MKQLLLQISPDFTPSLDNFVTGRNAEVLQLLRHILADREAERFVYLWGEPGSGKTHLLKSFVQAAREGGMSAVYVAPGEAALSHAELAAHDAIAADDVDRLDAASQIELFYAYNRLREEGGILLAGGAAAPAHLNLRQDLVTRLGWGLVYQVHALSDVEKAGALQTHARERGFALGHGVAEYLLRHWRRDLPSLVAALDTLDRYSLETKRPVTVPLLREVLAQPESGSSKAG